MKVSKRGLYSLEAMMHLVGIYPEGTAKIHEIAVSEHIPEKFLETILCDLKRARLVESVRGAHGGYRLKRDPSTVTLGEIIRITEGPLAPLGDAETLGQLVEHDARHSSIYKVLLDVRNAAAEILDHTSLSDLAGSASRPA